MTGSSSPAKFSVCSSLPVLHGPWSHTLPSPPRASSAHPSVLVRLSDHPIWEALTFLEWGRLAHLLLNSQCQHGVWNLDIIFVWLNWTEKLWRKWQKLYFSLYHASCNGTGLELSKKLCLSPSVNHRDQRSSRAYFGNFSVMWTSAFYLLCSTEWTWSSMHVWVWVWVGVPAAHKPLWLNITRSLVSSTQSSSLQSLSHWSSRESVYER